MALRRLRAAACAPFVLSASLSASHGDLGTELAELDLRSGSIVELAAPVASSGNLVFEVPLGGVVETLVVRPHSVRSAAYRLLVQGASGELAEVTPTPARTYRGVVAGHPGSRVALSALDGGVVGWIRLGPDELWGLQPVEGAHVVYRADDASAPAGTCVLVGTPGAPDAAGVFEAAAGSDLPIQVELGVDVDYEQFVKNGGTVEASEADVEALLNAMGVIYEEDLDLVPLLSALIVRAFEPDPYFHTSITLLLGQVANHWQGAQGGVERDVVQLLTGKVIDGFPIGGAFPSGVCSNSEGYAVSESSYTRNYVLRVALLSHELGHGLGAVHCDQAPGGCQIMCSGTHDFCGEVTGFANKSVNAITNFVAAANCLDDGVADPVVPPVLTGVVPAQIPSLAPGAEHSVSLLGTDLLSVAQVTLDGVPLTGFPPPYVFESETEIRIDMPQLEKLGAITIGIEGPAGSDTIGAELVAAAPPALQLGAGDEPEVFTSFAPVEFLVGGAPGDLAIVWGSLELAPTTFPGVASLDIGGGVRGLTAVAYPTIGAVGWVAIELAPVQLPSATTVYFQALTLDPVSGRLPLDASNVQSGLWLF